jgi:acetyl esterase
MPSLRKMLRRWASGVPVTTVRYDGTIHDFMLLNALSETHATRAAIDQATAFLRAGLGTG